MWDTVAQLEQPEPYELLVRDIKRLTKYEKKQDVSLQAWLVGLEEIYDSLQAVQFPVTDMLRIGFLLTLLESDTRFAAIIKEAKSKRWTYAKCLTKFGRHAVLIKDTAADSASKSPSKKAQSKMPRPPHERVRVVVNGNDYRDEVPETTLNQMILRRSLD